MKGLPDARKMPGVYNPITTPPHSRRSMSYCVKSGHRQTRPTDTARHTQPPTVDLASRCHAVPLCCALDNVPTIFHPFTIPRRPIPPQPRGQPQRHTPHAARCAVLCRHYDMKTHADNKRRPQPRQRRHSTRPHYSLVFTTIHIFI